MTGLAVTAKWHPVVGLLTPYMGGPFSQFWTPTTDGLVMVEGKRIDILAVVSREQRCGNFSRFLDNLKAHYDTIGVWEIWNQRLSVILARHGFRSASELIDGEQAEGMRWDRAS